MGKITYRCTGVSFLGTLLGWETLVIHLSAGGASTFLPRRLSQGAYQLHYNLYVDAARTSIWGDGSGATGVYGPVVPPEGSSVSVPIYARIPPLQNARAGTYGDTIVATVIF